MYTVLTLCSHQTGAATVAQGLAQIGIRVFQARREPIRIHGPLGLVHCVDNRQRKARLHQHPLQEA